MINNNFNPIDLSNTDLETLVQIVQGKTENEWKAYRDSYFQKLQKVKDWWGKEIKAYNEKLKKEMKDNLPLEIKGKQKQNEIKLPFQFNLKPFNYQIIQANSIKQQESCVAVAINQDCSIVAAGCNTLIKIYEFKQGMLKLNQVLNQHQNEVNVQKTFTIKFCQINIIINLSKQCLRLLLHFVSVKIILINREEQ
ncbi:unnamed protein product [Paramecium pentaurelia]|uniref:WD40-repeat-containing domain n=1 Tax=Paramecium pentaurelia TaxID=43138 RepID=A0A8S1X7R1_9CILI|nr:unnamed protein product [Paramecium pentaurelia]